MNYIPGPKECPGEPSQTYFLAARYAAATFLGAFLLFQVQPLLAKAILPWFGGAPAVWTTCLLFFQTLLLGGYLYAHLLTTRLAPRSQAAVHCALLLASLAFLNIMPSDYWRPDGPGRPAWRILLLLAANIGVPYLLLSATSPLIQAWFRTAAPGVSPYRLYALSNAGSLLALLSYPFVFEPLLKLKTQALLWGGLYAAFAAACAWCALPFLRSRKAAAPAQEQGGARPSAGEMALWLALAAGGSAILMASTNQLTQNVASAPFLWVLPLALYLLSFILCFEGDRWYRRGIWTVFLMAACAGTGYLLREGVEAPLGLQVLIHSLALFIACMVCHGELAARRPASRHLTSFYLLVSAGGALGGLLVAVAAPLLLDGPWEYHLVWAGAAFLAVFLPAAGQRPLLRTLPGVAAWGVLLILCAGFSYALYGHYKNENLSRVAMVRNFYGTLNVYESECGGAPTRTLMHGQVEHGFQFAEGDSRRRQPVSYYAAATGVGIAVRTLRRRAAAEKRPLRLGLVGLGAGIMAAWGLPGDMFVFYEINPLVLRLAREHFSYLDDSAAAVDTVPGDARLSLQREAAAGARPLDLLVLDAFSSDSIPLHLLTAEAFETYFKRLRPGGVLAVHITNRFVDLQPLVRGLAERAGKRAVWVENYEDKKTGAAGSEWALVTADENFLKEPLVAKNAGAWAAGREPLVFTDQYSNLFRLLKY